MAVPIILLIVIGMIIFWMLMALLWIVREIRGVVRRIDRRPSAEIHYLHPRPNQTTDASASSSRYPRSHSGHQPPAAS